MASFHCVIRIVLLEPQNPNDSLFGQNLEVHNSFSIYSLAGSIELPEKNGVDK